MAKPALFDPHPYRKSVTLTPEHFQKRQGNEKPTYSNLRDQNCYVPVDLPPNVCIGESESHNHIYIEGITGENSEVRMRDGIFSARALGKNSKVDGGGLIIISDLNLSRQSVNLPNGKMGNTGGSTVLVVPEEIRHQVFDAVVNEYGYSPWQLDYSGGSGIERLNATLAPFKKHSLEFIPDNRPKTKAFLEAAGLLGKSPD